MTRLVQTVPPQLGEVRLAGAASGVALSTTAVTTSLPPGAQLLTLTPRNFATAVVMRYQLCPWLTILLNKDSLLTQPVDASFLLQDGDNTNTLVINSFPALAAGGAIYIGCSKPFRGLDVDVQNTNGTANALAGKYPQAAGVLAALSITDNTDTGPSLAQDGTITWTVPSDWAAMSFNHAFHPPADFKGAIYEDKLYWVRLDFSVALDSSTSLNQIKALARSTAYDEIAAGQIEQLSVEVGYGPRGISAVEALTDAGTCNLELSCATLGNQKFAPAAAVPITV